MRTKYTLEQIDFLSDNRFLSRAELTQRFNDFFNTKKSTKAISAICKKYDFKNGRNTTFKKGHTPKNKGVKNPGWTNSGSFKKGQISHNKASIGEERVTTDGFLRVKIANPNVWKMKSHIVWENYGKTLKKGYAIIHKDCDRLNFNISNLAMISRSQLLILNRMGYSTKDNEVRPSLLLLSKLKAKIYEFEKQNGDSNG